MFKQIELGAKVIGQDDKNLGSVKYIIANSQDNQVTHIIVEIGELTPTLVVVEKKWIENMSPDGKIITLSLSEEQLKDLPDFIDREYTSSPGSDPENYPVNNDQDINLPIGYLYPAMNGAPPVTTLNGEMALPPEAAQSPANFPYTEKMNVPEDSLIIKEGAEVEAKDGNIGKVKKVNINPQNGKLESFLVEKGFFFKDEYLVPVDFVDTATDMRVNLNLTKDEMERLA